MSNTFDTLLGLSKLAGFHLDLAVVLIVDFLRGRNKVMHVRADQKVTQLLKVAVFLVLYFGTTPGILTTLDLTAIGRNDVFCRTNNRERHGTHNVLVLCGNGFVITFDWTRIDANVLGSDNIQDLANSLMSLCVNQDGKDTTELDLRFV